MKLVLPEEIRLVIETIEAAGFPAYIVGGSVRDSLLGVRPGDWDLAAGASAAEIAGLFPDSVLIGERFGVVRVTVGGETADIAAMRIDGTYSDHRRPDAVVFTDEIEKDLSRRDFTVNGMAYNPRTGLVDPFGGQRDLAARILRAIGKPEERFTEDPLRILRALRFCGQLGFDIALETFTFLQKTVPLLAKISIDRRREEFEKLLISPHAGKALKMCVVADVFPWIVRGCYPPEGERESADFSLMLQNIDRVRADIDSRYTVFFYCFDRRRALDAAGALGMNAAQTVCLDRFLGLMRELCLSADDRFEIKQILCRFGREFIDCAAGLASEIDTVFGGADSLVGSRCRLLREIRESGEPLFIEDLAVGGKDLLETGIPQGEKIGETLAELLAAVHRDPAENTRSKLMKILKKQRGSLFDRLRSGQAGNKK